MMNQLNKMNASFLLVLFISFSIIECANILVMLPLPLYSHTIAYMPVIKEMAKRGHNVTLVTPFPEKNKIPNINEIVVPALYKEITDPSMFVLSKRSSYENLKIFWDFGIRSAEVALKLDAVKMIFSLPSNSFDLVMAETFFVSEPMSALQHKFKCPLVNLHPWSLTIPIAYFSGNPLLSSVIPSVYSSHTDDMSFLQRANNVLLDLMELAGNNLYYLPKQDETMRKLLSGVEGLNDLPHIKELLSKTSLSLIDAHHTLDFKKPYFRNVIEIGGLTVHNKEEASKELQQFMDASKQGFIYFSLGSHLPTSMIPADFKEKLFKAFEKLKENVIMKWDNQNEEKPKNVRIEKWLPQVNVLSHPNCKLFITHGGLHGLQEATYYKVPIVGIPLVADQFINIQFVEHAGLGLSINVLETTEDLILNTIQSVLNEKKYKEAVAVRSALFKDNPISAVDNAVYHLEYLLRHKDSHNFQSPLLQRYWYEQLLLDVWMLLALTLLLLVTAILALVRMMMLLLNVTKKKKKSKSH